MRHSKTFGGWQGYGDLTFRLGSATGLIFQSALMTITDVGFTKHYFTAGAALSLPKWQRIASKLGESLANSEMQPLKENPVEPLTENYKVLNIGAAERMRRNFECLGLNYDNFTPGEPVIQVLEELAGVGDADETNIYFYHSDHLGSSSFLTDINGDATQHLQYTRTEPVECVPFGEDFGWSLSYVEGWSLSYVEGRSLSPVEGRSLSPVEGRSLSPVEGQSTAAYFTPYTFSGKERDMETGLSYFGARYYDAGLSIWLSVDALADKYPSISSYNYCAWNPVMLVDSDGREILVTKSTENGVTNVHIRFNAKIINTSKTEMTCDQIQEVGDMIARQIEKSFSGEYEGMNVTVDASIASVSSFSELNGGEGLGGDHLFNIADAVNKNLIGDDRQALLGVSLICGTTAHLNELFVSNPDQMTRTGGHEFGHLAGLDHPDGKNNRIPDLGTKSPKNLMHQSKVTLGTEIIKEQIMEIIKNFSNE